MKKQTRRSKKPRSARKAVVLDAFTQQQMHLWESQGDILQRLSDRVYFELERQRAQKYDALCGSLRSAPSIAVDVTNWARVTDWRWNLTPLSAAGSLNGIGGRFNIGNDLDRARNQAFPCLYIAENVDTALGEYFGGSLSSTTTGLSLSEFALRRATSFTTFLLRGQLVQVLDLRSDKLLGAFADIIKGFDISQDTKSAVLNAGLPPRAIMRSAKEMYKQLLAPPSEWRLEPQAYGSPAACQIFGRFVQDAGLEGILFPSQQGSGSCLAVYPVNFRASDGHIEAVGAVPEGATHTILDKDHLP
jgi:RES domain